MFLTRHKLLHESERVPRLPLSISHCWINTTLEYQKLLHGDIGYSEVISHLITTDVQPLTPQTEDENSTVSGIIPDEFKTKPNLDRRSSEVNPADISDKSSQSSRRQNVETPPLKDRDWRGREGEEMWWETVWEGMDGIGGTNKKGKRCFDRVRIWWKEEAE